MSETLLEVESPSPLAAEVFDRISDRFAGCAGDISRLVGAGWAFDEWLVWEAFLACVGHEGWSVSPRPAYASLGRHGDADFGALLVKAGDQSVVVELGLVHDYSGDVFVRKLEASAHKLDGPFSDGVWPLQLIVCASARDVRADPTWQEWLGKLELWNREPRMEHYAALEHGGSLVVRAFG